MINYKLKYLKYKLKYLKFKGGTHTHTRGKRSTRSITDYTCPLCYEDAIGNDSVLCQDLFMNFGNSTQQSCNKRYHRSILSNKFDILVQS